MTDTAKKRLAIDLDEIERQLRQTAPQHSAPKNDPLAELARVIGQEDPFRAILSADRAGVEPRRTSPEADDIFALAPEPRAPLRNDYSEQRDEEIGHDQAQQDFREPPHWDHAQPHSFDTYMDEADQPRYAQAPQRQDDYPDEVHANPAHANATAYQQQEEWREPEAYYDQPHDDHYDDSAYDMDRTPRARSRKGLLTVGAVLGVAVLGVASALVFSGGDSGMIDGEPPLISAGTEPIKIAPENPGGVEIPNQNRQIFGGASDGETQIVNREEQPVDIGEIAREAPRVILPPPAALQEPAEDDPISQVLAGLQPAEGLQAPSAVSTAVAALGEPRRVRTVSVRPDGTIIGRPSAAPVAEAQPEPRTMSDLAPPEPQILTPAELPQVSSDPAPPAPVTPVAQAEPAVPVEEPPQVQPSAPSGPLALTGALPPIPQRDTPPAQAESPREVAAIPAPAPAPAPVAPVTAPTGGYAVQLAIRETEERAYQAFSQYQARYAGIIGNVDPIVRRAQVNGNTIYRIRVGPYGLSDANTICEQIKGTGGDCFVARN